MARRTVTHTRKYCDRVIAVGNPDQWWSPRGTLDVIVDIDTGLHRYYVTDTDGRVVILTVDGPTGQQCHAPGLDGADLLAQLPDC